MGKQQLECPSCHGAIALGDIRCPHCGVNLKSGESFETQVKRAKGKVKHPEAYTGGLYIGIALALGLVIFAGYMYQRSVERVLADRSATFSPLIEKLQQVRDDADAGRYDVARQNGEALLKDIQVADDSIKPGVAFDVGEVANSYGTNYNKPKGDERAAKRILANLAAKTQHILDSLPSS
jgi:hypothetical protein